MYYIGNVTYFLGKKKFPQAAIDKIVQELEGQAVNKGKGDMGFVVSGSVQEALDTDTYFTFTRDFQNDPMHLKIAAGNGFVPEIKPMSDGQILQRMEEMQKDNPSMFSHPKARPNEVWLGDQGVDFVHINVSQYQQIGMASARIDKSEPVMKPMKEVSGNVAHYSVFVDAVELIKAEYEYKQKEALLR